MRLLTPLWAMWLIAQVYADVLATPYQMVYLWEAYQMDLAAMASESRTGWIATKCTSCTTLDGFLKYILKYPSSWTGSTGITGTGADKTVAEIADAIRSSGYSGVTDSGKILPWEYYEGQTTNFQQVYGRVTDYVDAIRAAHGDAFVATHLERSAQAMNQALARRRVSQQAKIFIDLQLLSDSDGYGFIMVMDKAGNIDSEATLATNPNAEKSMASMMRDFIGGNWPADVLEMPSVKPIYKAVISHNNAMTSCQDCLNRLSTALPCNSTPSKAKRRASNKRNHGRMLAKSRFSAYLSSS